MSSSSMEFSDRNGTTLVIIRTPTLVVFNCDSRATQSRSGRVAWDDVIKYEKITSTVYAAGTGNSYAAEQLYKKLGEKYKEESSPTLKEIADYALECVNDMKISIGTTYAFIGLENGRPEAYYFAKNNPGQESVELVTKWWASGCGSLEAEVLLNRFYYRDITDSRAESLGNMALAASAIGNPYTGGIIRALVFNSDGLSSSKFIPTLELYLTYYNQWSEDHSSTIYLFSLGRISDGAVTQWFRSGYLIEKVDVTSVHVIGEVQGYYVRRVVLKDKDPSTVIKEVQNVCDAHGCSEEINGEITTFPCLAILHEKFHFAQLTKDRLCEVCGY